jgi:hypothetical protein
MLRKMGLIAVLMAILSLPLAAFAQDLSRSEDVNTANVAHNSFVLQQSNLFASCDEIFMLPN